MSKLNKQQKQMLVDLVTKLHNYLVTKKQEMEKMMKLRDAIMGVAPDSIVKQLKKETAKREKKVANGMKKISQEIIDVEAIISFVKEVVKK